MTDTPHTTAALIALADDWLAGPRDDNTIVSAADTIKRLRDALEKCEAEAGAALARRQQAGR